MNNNKEINSYIITNLINILSVNDWSQTQYDTYKLVKHYVDNFKEESIIYETKDDKIIIRNNFKEQTWFTYSKSKPIISNLLDSMKLNIHTFQQNEYCINLYVVLSFEKFQLNGCLYKNLINNCVNYYVYIENDSHQKAYLTYYTPSNENNKKVKLPEFEKMYKIINIDKSIFYQCDLLNFLAEIIMYYDESETIGDLPIGNNINVTLNQLLKKLNIYVLQKHNETNYITI